MRSVSRSKASGTPAVQSTAPREKVLPRHKRERPPQGRQLSAVESSARRPDQRVPVFDVCYDATEILTAVSRSGFDRGRVFLRPTGHPALRIRVRNVVLRDFAIGVIGTAHGDNVNVRPRIIAERYCLTIAPDTRP